MEKRKIHLEDLFSRKNEENGVWFEPKIEGQGCGIEFLVCGAGTDEAVADDEHFDSLYAKADEIMDPIERSKQRQLVDAQRCARLVKGIRPAPDCDVDYEGGALEYSVPLIESIFYDSPLIKKAVVAFSTKTANFIKREKRS